MLTIYHNPKCSKSRETLELIKKNGTNVKVIEYLKEIPSEKELKGILQKLGMRPEAIVRKKETIYKEKYKGKTFTDEDWIRILVQNPKLIERPIVVKEQKAILGRPPENVLQLI